MEIHEFIEEADMAKNSTKDIKELNPQQLRVRIFIRFGIFLLILVGILFGTAGTITWPMGWAFLGGYWVIVLISAIVVPVDADYVEERTTMKEDVKQWDKYLAGIPSLLFPWALLIVAGLDHRFGWSVEIGIGWQITALVVALLAYLISVWASVVNKFYARFVRIQTERGHHPITTGPYAIIRHPGYFGIGLFSLLVPIALDSYWTLIPGGLMAVLLVVRTALEDKTLQEELEGYAEYAKQTRYRLLPGIW
jgi:protein-S-isoprenylcysteine O-methyltransferase Ste14